MYSAKVKNIIPLFKICYKKNKLVSIDYCNCINKCRLENNYHNSKQIQLYTKLDCELTNFKQKIGDCSCIDTCSAKQNDLELLYEMELLSLPN